MRSIQLFFFFSPIAGLSDITMQQGVPLIFSNSKHYFIELGRVLFAKRVAESYRSLLLFAVSESFIG